MRWTNVSNNLSKPRREDEQFIMECVRSFLRRSDPAIEILPGKDRPDFIVRSGGKEIPLEVTRAEIEFEDNGVRRSKQSHDHSLLDLVSGMNAKYPDHACDYCLHIHILGPVENPRSFRKRLDQTIAGFIKDSSGIPYGQLCDYSDVDGERVMILKGRRKPGQEFLLGSVGDKNHVATILIQDQTDTMYSNSVLKKDRMVVAIEGEKWLAIYNGYPLAEAHNIKEALDKLRMKHGFTRVFVVSMQGLVLDVDTQSSNSACS